MPQRSIWIVLITANVAYGQQYEIIDLGSLRSTDNQRHATSVNDFGDVVGYTGNEDVAFRWSDGSGMQPLSPPLGFDRSHAWAINNLGTVVGSIDKDGGFPNAVSWDPSGTLHQLTELPGYNYSEAEDINDLGEIVGYSYYFHPIGSTSQSRATVWNGSSVTSLGILPGYTDSYAFGINESGQIVGLLGNSSQYSPYAAFSWTAGSGMTILDLNSAARSVNDSGVIVGYKGDRAFVWDSTNGSSYLPDLGSGSDARSINSNGQIVGDVFINGNAERHAVTWINHQLTDLNTYLPAGSSWDYLSQAASISNNGAIVGTGYISGDAHAFLMRPTTPAGPATIDLALEDFRSSGVLGYQFNGSEVTFGSSGVFMFDTMNPQGANAALVGNPAYGFCIELQQTYSGDFHSYHVVDLSSANDPISLTGHITMAQSDLVAQLWAEHFDPSWITSGPHSSDQILASMAFHAALLEILSDFDGSSLDSLNIDSGLFHLVSGYILDINDPSQELPVREATQALISSLTLDYKGRLPHLLALTNANYQDYVVEVVPEGRSIVMATIGVLIVLFGTSPRRFINVFALRRR